MEYTQISIKEVKKIMKNTNLEGMSKNCSNFITHSNFSDRQFKIDCSKYSLTYIKHMVTTNQKFVRGFGIRNKQKDIQTQHDREVSIYKTII